MTKFITLFITLLGLFAFGQQPFGQSLPWPGPTTVVTAAAPACSDTNADAWKTAVIGDGGSVSDTQYGYVCTLITGLKTDAIWSTYDRIWLYASENAFQAARDIVATSLHTVVSTPAFTANRGYAGEDASNPTKYIDTNFNPTAGGLNFSTNTAHFSIWSVTNTAPSNGGADIGYSLNSGTNGVNLYDTFADGNIYARLNDSTDSGSQGSPGTRAGHWLLDRSDSTHTTLYQNASSFSTPNTTAGTLQNRTFFALAQNNDTVGAQHGTPNQLAMVSIGGHLSSSNVTSSYNRFRTYMNSVGVP